MKECLIAIRNNELEKLADCIKKYGVNTIFNKGTMLHTAVFQNNLEAVEYLLDQGADPNILYDHSETPLIAAIDNKQWEIAKRLIQKGANVNLKDASNNSPLSKAILRYEGNTELLHLLMAHGSDPQQDLLNGYTPMDLARSMKLSTLIQTLIKKTQTSQDPGTR